MSGGGEEGWKQLPSESRPQNRRSAATSGERAFKKTRIFPRWKSREAAYVKKFKEAGTVREGGRRERGET